MNKLDFLRRLNKELGILDEKEKKEILGFYEERFYSGTIYENKTEEEVISELESPEVIARNVLEEYGVSPKYVKTKEERYSGIDPSKLVILILFDVFIGSWIIPTLFSIVVGIFGSLLSYVAVIPLLFGTRTETDVYMFAFSTAAYVLLFLFGLVVLELSIYVTKKIFLYHMNVLKFRNREKISKKLHKVSVDGWFKKHKSANTFKSILFVTALIVIVFTGFNLVTGENNVFDVYSNQPKTTDLYTEDLNADIIGLESWGISTDFDYMDVEIIPVLGDELKITHRYAEDNDFSINIDKDQNVIIISNDVPMSNLRWFSYQSLLTLFSESDSIKIEVPVALLLGDIDIVTHNGEVTILDLEVGELNVSSSNGRIRLDSMTINAAAVIKTLNGQISIQDVVSIYNLEADTSNGRIVIEDSEFRNYNLDTSNGEIYLENLNVSNKDGVLLIADTSNGKIKLVDVYVKDVRLDTSNGDIDFHNSDLTFVVENFDRDTSNGQISSNVD